MTQMIGQDNNPMIGKIDLIKAIRQSVLNTTGHSPGLFLCKQMMEKILPELQAEVNRKHTSWGVGDRVYDSMYPTANGRDRHGLVIWANATNKTVLVLWDGEEYPIPENQYWGDLKKVQS